MPPSPRKAVASAIAMLAAAGILSVPASAQAASPATAAPTAAAGAVYFVHGIDWNHSSAGDAQINCESAWKAAKAALTGRGWTGSLVTWGFYAKDTRCTRKFNGTLNTRIQELGRKLAWDIHDNHTKQGEPVDVVGHSMGGLIVRAAIEGVRRYGQNADWPDSLQIRDVVTFSAPHTGTGWATTCTALRGWKQCSDMRPGSGFLSWAGQNPQAAGGTDWTLIGASDDDMITSGSATGMRAKHKWIYASGQGLEHSTVKNKGAESTGWKARYTDDYATTWLNQTNGAGPLGLMHDALSSTAR
ncbi:esterase/lipase family protein [Spirillospora sp. NPDC048911]|uniref:esterase/lipase family protein n=1 Tax=Spirillospora sp. NPDC048911 TaxID=3364527 RepID=UPI00371863C2